MTLKKTKRHTITETEQVWVTLPLVSLPVYYCLSKGKEIPSLHFDPELKHEKMKQTLNTALNIFF